MLTFLIAKLSSSRACWTRTQLGFFRHNASHIPYSFSSVVKLSRPNQPEQNGEGNPSFTVSYLMNSCGMSAKVAGEASKRVELKETDQPDSVLNLFRSYGFSNTHVCKIVKWYPRLLLANPEKTFLPRLRFIQSIGFSASEIPELFAYNSIFLTWSFEKRIIPHYEALKRVLGDDWKVRISFKCSWWNIGFYDVNSIVPNMKVLRDEGVPQSSVFSLLSKSANVAFMNHSMFVECVKLIKETGIEPFRLAFIQALVVLAGMKKSTWELKLDIFERCGWSREVTFLAFSKFPACMLISEKKITSIMKFLVDEMGLPLKDIAGCPILLAYSLEKRIIPRCSVIKILKMKGLIKKNVSIPAIVIMSEKKFLENFVIKFQESVPQLPEIHRGELRPLPEFQA